MTHSPRFVCVTVMTLALVLGARTQGWAQADPAFPVGVWAQQSSDLAPDPRVRFGQLPNGMRFALMKNATPTGEASLRLRFDAGSLWETDAQQGLAHFLEHMAFNGSKNVPEGEMTKILERHGLAFGADTNASTAWTETVYKLDLPHTDDDTVDTSLMLLREAAGSLLIAPDAVERERGVVLSEERARDTPSYRLFKQRELFLLKGQLAPLRMPIGQVDVVAHAPAALIADFYAGYYRPERATLVAAGDFDLDAMEAKIRAHFGDWTARSAAAPREPDLGALAPRGREAKVVVEPGAPLTLQIGWLHPAELGPDSALREQADLIDRLGLAVLNRRLEHIARGQQPPFIAAAADKGDQFRSAEATTLSVRAGPDGWRTALAAVEHEQRRLLQFGVRQDELDREIQEMRTGLQSAVAAEQTQKTQDLANTIADDIDARDVVRSPSQDLELFEAAVQNLTADRVTRAMRDAFSGQGPLIFLASPATVAGGDEAVKAAFDQAGATALQPPAAEVVKPWPYVAFGRKGTVASEKEVLDLNADFVVFRNGVRLTVKPTKFRDDQILVRVRIGDGRKTLDWTGPNVAWMAGQAFTEGGLRKLTAEELDRIMASRIVGADLGVDDDAFVLSGATRPDDFTTQLQLLAAYLTEPGLRPEAFARWQAYGATLNRQYASTASGVLRRDLPRLIHDGDKRWAFPSSEEIAASTPRALASLLKPVSPSSPIEVVVVGDISPDKAIDAVASTFGALPPASSRAKPQKPIRFPAPDASPIVLTHKGRADQSIGYVAWPTDDFYTDINKSRAVRVLSYVMQLRLTDQLREKEGATYSPSADASASDTFDHYGFLAATVEEPPARLDSFFSEVDAIAADLRDHEVSTDELDRAKASRIQALEKAKQTNEYWLGALGRAQSDPRVLPAVRSAEPGLERVSAAEVRQAALAYLDPAKAWRLKVLPEAATAQPLAASRAPAAAAASSRRPHSPWWRRGPRPSPGMPPPTSPPTPEPLRTPPVGPPVAAPADASAAPAKRSRFSRVLKAPLRLMPRL